MKRFKEVIIPLVLVVILTGATYVVTRNAAKSAATLSAGTETTTAEPAAILPADTRTTTPIKHVVVLFQENNSFDHYFGTYPNATNPAGEPNFTAKPGTPSVNGLTPELLTHNPNQTNPWRIDRTQAYTCDQDHDYTPEQKAFNHGLMNKFVESTSGDKCLDKTLVMGYFDGNTVTALWNYAQQYSISDNFFGTTFGPSTPGALNLVSGQTHGATATGSAPPDELANGTIIGDLDPAYDGCSVKTPKATMSGKNVGDLLNAKNVSWGWFQAGFKPTSVTNGVPTCATTHKNIAGIDELDYDPHHEPFQYYATTANPNHLPPSSVGMIGKTDQANHQYDQTDFWDAAQSGNLPAVSFLKAARSQDGHPATSDPLDEQTYLVNTVNRLEKLPQWKNMAIIITYDDSDGWYDHVMSPIVSQSSDPQADELTDDGQCGVADPDGDMDRCGHGPRLPLLVLSPFAKANFVDHALTDQTSILRFIEDNWNLGRIGNQSFDASAGSLSNLFDFTQKRENHRLFLDPQTGEVLSS